MSLYFVLILVPISYCTYITDDYFSKMPVLGICPKILRYLILLPSPSTYDEIPTNSRYLGPMLILILGSEKSRRNS